MIVALLALSLATGADLDKLERDLNDSEAPARRTAVQELAKLDTPEAWALVIRALRDPQPRVADQAQIELGKLTDVHIVEALCGRDGLSGKDDWVRLRVAEALGRAELELDPAWLEKGLRVKDSDSLRALLWTIERQAIAQRIAQEGRDELRERLGKLRRRDKNARVRAAALVAELALGAEATDVWAEVADDDAAEVRSALVQSIAARSEHGLADALAVYAEDEHVAVRRAVVEALADDASPAAMRSLVDMLERETSARLAWSIVERLQAASGRKHGADARPWREWTRTLDDGWQPGRAGREREYGEQSVAFVGMPVLSENIAILIDFSGSLWQERADGTTRKQKIDVEIERTLQALPESARFNLIPYIDDPIPWRDGLVEASPRNVEKALEFFASCNQQGKGNVWDALLFALEDPDVDTILVLTDGAPSGGHRWNIELLADLFIEHNRFRGVVLDAVLVGAPGFLEHHWRRMCEASGGRVLAIDD